MHYLITGHTGFKGAWMVMLLRSQGHRVSGIALDPEPGSLYEAARLDELVDIDVRLDVRDSAGVANSLNEIAPDVVVHMAAQPIVRESYRSPRWTMETNVLGTLNVLEAVQSTPSVRAHLVITTDKVYKNTGREHGYVEDDALGGPADPYSASKAMADILTQSWVSSFTGPPTAIARGGNVVGGGDHSTDRLLPDLLRAFTRGEPTKIRYPAAVRPWQHVLDCLSGYLTITGALLEGRGTGEWNIGPGRESFVTVGEIATLASRLWGEGASWEQEPGDHLHEANLLALDARKAGRELGWSDRLTFPSSIEWVIDWHRALASGEQPREITASQIARYLEQS